MTLPVKTYHDAPQTGNVWVKQSDEESNTSRVLLVQFSTDLINADARPDASSAYYDKLYSGARPGYCRLRDFWEIPQWVAYAAHFLPNADFYVVRNLEEAKRFLQTAGYGRVAFSVLDVTRDLVREIAQSYTGQIDLGGYSGGAQYFLDLPHVKWYDSMCGWAQSIQAPYREGTDYRHFAGCKVVPRLTMSQGCKFHCVFCDVPKAITVTPLAVILQQANSFGVLDFKLIYLNDKTFGQAENYRELAHVYSVLKARNPLFRGFIAQTTALHALRLTKDSEWLRSGICYVELGIETYNDSILASYNKPQSFRRFTDLAVAALRENGIALIPNIIVGFPEETGETYANTLGFLRANLGSISHINIYNLAVYRGAELSKRLAMRDSQDNDENTLVKSWHRDLIAVCMFADSLYSLASEALDHALGGTA
jgi:hypothetical protein